MTTTNHLYLKAIVMNSILFFFVISLSRQEWNFDFFQIMLAILGGIAVGGTAVELKLQKLRGILGQDFDFNSITDTRKSTFTSSKSIQQILTEIEKTSALNKMRVSKDIDRIILKHTFWKFKQKDIEIHCTKNDTTTNLYSIKVNSTLISRLLDYGEDLVTLKKIEKELKNVV